MRLSLTSVLWLSTKIAGAKPDKQLTVTLFRTGSARASTSAWDANCHCAGPPCNPPLRVSREDSVTPDYKERCLYEMVASGLTSVAVHTQSEGFPAASQLATDCAELMSWDGQLAPRRLNILPSKELCFPLCTTAVTPSSKHYAPTLNVVRAA